ncbi:MAG: DNA translocase FtsK [Alicyclobacillus sp.]|nr:DNA translocase FtsK [Alicyclobacillus sp.]
MGRKQHKDLVLKYELTGIVMLALSALAFGNLGLVGRYLDVAFVYLAGSWSFLVPIFIGYAAIYIMVQRAAFNWTTRHMGLLVLFITWLTAMEFDLYQHIQQMQVRQPVSLFTATLNAIQSMSDGILATGARVPLNGAGGGLIGYATFTAAHALFGTVGTLFVLGVGVLIGGALVTQRSLVAGVQRGSRWMEQCLEGLWRGCRRYVSVLFGPDPTARSSRERTEAEPEAAPARRSRRKPQLIVDGEVLSDSDEPSFNSEASVQDIPVVRDYVSNLRAKQHAEPTAPVMETVGNQLVMHFPEFKRPSKSVQEVPKEESYEVGEPVQDDNYQLPPIQMFALSDAPRGVNQKSAQDNARKLEMTLESFGVQAKVLEIARGPTVTRYEVQPAVGVTVRRIVNLTDDIALALAARDIRMEAPVPGKSVIGIEVPNQEISIVTLRDVMESSDFQNDPSLLTVAIGRDISGSAIVGNLQKMPHLLVAGATGAGKSVCINGLIASILVKAKPHEVKFLMIDPKMVELSGYNGIPHLLAPVVIDPRKAAYALGKIVQEMEHRYQQFADRGARDIERFNQMMRDGGQPSLPYIVVIIDELADLMMVAPGDVEDAIQRIAQKARAAGIHLIVATQRPSVDVITGVIKANIPSRIAFAVSSMADSRTILDSGGAEKLLGRGDMLYLPAGASKPVRVQGAFVSDQEIEKLVAFVKEQQNAVYTVDLNHVEEPSDASSGDDLDDLFYDAVDLVIEAGHASAGLLQRRFKIGYPRASRIIDQMEQRGFIGRFEGSKPREVLITADQWRAMRDSGAAQEEV